MGMNPHCVLPHQYTLQLHDVIVDQSPSRGNIQRRTSCSLCHNYATHWVHLNSLSSSVPVITMWSVGVLGPACIPTTSLSELWLTCYPLIERPIKTQPNHLLVSPVSSRFSTVSQSLCFTGTQYLQNVLLIAHTQCLIVPSLITMIYDFEMADVILGCYKATFVRPH